MRAAHCGCQGSITVQGSIKVQGSGKVCLHDGIAVPDAGNDEPRDEGEHDKTVEGDVEPVPLERKRRAGDLKWLMETARANQKQYSVFVDARRETARAVYVLGTPFTQGCGTHMHRYARTQRLLLAPRCVFVCACVVAVAVHPCARAFVSLTRPCGRSLSPSIAKPHGLEPSTRIIVELIAPRISAGMMNSHGKMSICKTRTRAVGWQISRKLVVVNEFTLRGKGHAGIRRVTCRHTTTTFQQCSNQPAAPCTRRLKHALRGCSRHRTERPMVALADTIGLGGRSWGWCVIGDERESPLWKGSEPSRVAQERLLRAWAAWRRGFHGLLRPPATSTRYAILRPNL